MSDQASRRAGRLSALVVASLAMILPVAAKGQSVPTGYEISVFAQPAALAGRHLAGMAVDPSTGDVYVASTPTIPGHNNYCNDWTLHRVQPDGTTTQVNNQLGPTFPASQLEVIELEWGPDDHIYACNESAQEVFRINPQTGFTNLYNSGHLAGGGRHGIQFDAQGNLIFVSEHHRKSTFYLIPPGNAVAVMLGSYLPINSPSERCVRFDIDANGDYIMFPEYNGPVSKITTAGHVAPNDFPITHVTAAQFPLCDASGFDLPYGGSLGALWDGHAYVSTANLGYGAGRILRVNMVTGAVTVFVDNIGLGVVTSNGCFDQRGVTDIAVGPRSDACSGQSLYFLDNYNQRIYEARVTCQPTAPHDLCSNALVLADGVTPGDNTLATAEAGLPGLCAAGSQDVWYSYTNTSCDADVTVSLCPTDGGSASFDAMLAVFSGACDALALVACSTNDCGNAPRVVFNAPAGSSYYVAVLAEGAGPGGAFNLAVSTVANAAVESFGTGTPASLVLTSSDPILGQILIVDVAGGAPNDYVILAAGFRGVAPFPQLPGGGEIYLIVESVAILATYPVNGSGQWFWGPTIPDMPALQCFEADLQAFVVPPPGQDWKVTNSVRLRLGY